MQLEKKDYKKIAEEYPTKGDRLADEMGISKAKLVEAVFELRAQGHRVPKPATTDIDLSEL